MLCSMPTHLIPIGAAALMALSLASCQKKDEVKPLERPTDGWQYRQDQEACAKQPDLPWCPE